MTILAMCVHCTDENDKLKYVKECLSSLLDTVDLRKHNLHIINNRSNIETTDYLLDFIRKNDVGAFHNLKTNIGTAAGINLAIKSRLPNQVVIKCDDDVKWHQSGWVEELEQVFIDNPEIGICGLKREDVYGDFTENGKLLISDDVMGTCTAFNPLMMDKVGLMIQPSIYGFDDNLYSIRSIAAGFKNCYLPHIGITHLDEGGTAYTDWKKREAGLYLNEVSNLINMYKTGQLSPYHDGGSDD